MEKDATVKELDLAGMSLADSWSDIVLDSLLQDPEGFFITHDSFLGLTMSERVELFKGIKFWGAFGPSGGICGLIGFGASDNGGSGPQGMYIRNMFVKPEFRGLGVAELLMEAVEKEAVKSGAVEVLLSVYETQSRAINFYEKCGYETIKKGKSESKPGTNWVLMGKSLHL